MVNRNSVLKNSLLLFVGGAIGQLFSFLFQVLIARTFGAQAYGRFAIVSSIILLTATLVTLGFKDAIIKWVGEINSNDEINSNERLSGLLRVSFGLSLLLSLVASGFLYHLSDGIVLRIFGSDALAEFLQIVSFATPGIVLASLAGATLLGFERAGARVWTEEIIPRGMLLISTILILTFGYSFLAVGTAYTGSFWVAGLVGLLLSLWVAGDKVRTEPTYDLRGMLSFSIPLLLGSQVALLSNWADTLLVGYFTTEALTGVYQAAFLLGTTVLIFMGAITGALYPNFSNLIGSDQGATLADRYREATRWAIMITAAPVLYLSFYPQLSLDILFGSEFSQAWGALMIIAIGNFGGVAVGPGTEVVKASGDSRFIFITESVGLLVNVLLNILLIPLVGIVGAAFGTATMTVLVNGAHFVRARQVFSVRPPTRVAMKALAAGGVAGGVSLTVSNAVGGIKTLIPHILLYSVIYTVVLYLIGGFEISEIYQVM